VTVDLLRGSVGDAPVVGTVSSETAVALGEVGGDRGGPWRRDGSGCQAASRDEHRARHRVRVLGRVRRAGAPEVARCLLRRLLRPLLRPRMWPRNDRAPQAGGTPAPQWRRVLCWVVGRLWCARPARRVELCGVEGHRPSGPPLATQRRIIGVVARGMIGGLRPHRWRAGGLPRSRDRWFHRALRGSPARNCA
jgi:hypothetical protein